MRQIHDLIQRLEAAGVTFRLEGDQPKATYPRARRDELKPLLEQLKSCRKEVLLFLRERLVKSRCRYDWLPGQRWQALECVAHKHATSTTAFRFLPLGHDILQDLAAQDMLTGQAALDSLAWTNPKLIA